MNSGFLPQLLMSATLVLMLAFAVRRSAIVGSLAFIACYGAMLLVPLPSTWRETAVVGLWISIVATAALIYLPPARWASFAILMSVNAGVWAGACAALGVQRMEVLAGLLPLLALPLARWLVARDFAIIIRVLASWLIAIASLATFVSLLSTPGYKPDHMQ